MITLLVSRADLRVTITSSSSSSSTSNNSSSSSSPSLHPSLPTPVLSQATPHPFLDGAFLLSLPLSLPPLGGVLFHVEVCEVTAWTEGREGGREGGGCAVVAERIEMEEEEEEEEGGREGGRMRMENGQYALTFSSETCGLARVMVKEGGKEGRVAAEEEVEVKQSFWIYDSPDSSVYFFRLVGKEGRRKGGREGVFERMAHSIYIFIFSS